MIVYVTVFMSPHIIPECNKLYELTQGKFIVIETREITEERRRLGYDIGTLLPYVRKYAEDVCVSNELILNSEVVIFAEIPNRIINRRILSNKLTFLSSERLFKRGIIKFGHYKLWKQILCNILAYGKNTHLLCDGALTGRDFALIGFNRDKMWKHGYFPFFSKYDLTELFSWKESSSVNILWVGRIIGWKRPMEFLEAIRILKRNKPDLKIHADIVGEGNRQLVGKIKKFIQKNELSNSITFHGLLNNETVIKMMQRANIFVSTSSKIEGWGVVVNEAMNSGCAVIVSDKIGCAGYLIENGQNGILYRSGSPLDLVMKLSQLISERERISELGTNAYSTIKDTWNGDESARRLLKLVEAINTNRESPYGEGPCSRAL